MTEDVPPLLLIVFNRPDKLGAQIEALRKVRPGRIYVSADGPRGEVPGERARCEETRAMVARIDWGAEVATQFHDENRGCRGGVESAIDWFFGQEDAGIVLEDDCIPHPDFFRFCAWGLAAYRDDPRVWHINGNTFGAPARLFGEDAVGFPALPQAWGWASWADRWARHSGDPETAMAAARARKRDWMISRRGRENMLARLRKLERHPNHTWDRQWQNTVLCHRGLCLASRSNLVTNIGDGADATHTASDPRVGLPTQALGALPETPPEPRLSRALTRWYEAKMSLRDRRQRSRLPPVLGRLGALLTGGR